MHSGVCRHGGICTVGVFALWGYAHRKVCAPWGYAHRGGMRAVGVCAVRICAVRVRAVGVKRDVRHQGMRRWGLLCHGLRHLKMCRQKGSTPWGFNLSGVWGGNHYKTILGAMNIN